MSARELADLATTLLIAAGGGLALVCAYLVRKPAVRTFRVWAGATLVAIPGLLLGVVLVHPELGVRAAYRGLTDALQEPLTLQAEIPAFPRPASAAVQSPEATAPTGVPSLAPSAGAPLSSSTATPPDPDETGTGSSTPPETTSPPPSPSPSPTPKPSPTTDPTPTPTPSETPSPTPTDSNQP
jgi:outer membrane biosynthesis protein TonB